MNPFQCWLDDYACHREGNFFSWMARNAVPNCPIDGGTIYIMSHILGQNITIISADSMWHAMDNCANDLCYMYLGESKFIKMEVGKFI